MPQPLESSQPYTYDPRLGAGGMYRNANGRVVKNKVIIREFERVQAGVKLEFDILLEQIQNDDITLQEFYTESRRKLKILHGLAGVIAIGGILQMTPSMQAFIGAQAKEQYLWLARLIQQIESGQQALDGTLRRRIRQFVSSARRIYFKVRTNVAQKAGFDEERRVVTAGESCSTRRGLVGCVQLAAMGWQPIGTLPDIGVSPCDGNCRCYKEFRRSILSPVENSLLSRFTNEVYNAIKTGRFRHHS